MNLLDASIPYFHTEPGILSLRPIALQTALQIHNGQLKTVPNGMRYQLGELAQPVRADGNSFMLPANFDFGKLSYAATKVLVACYRLAKGSRQPFRITVTREELAETAKLSLLHCRKGLRELEAKRLVSTKQLRDGVQISLLDPEHGSGTPLYWMAQFNRDRLNSIPAYQWYRLLLHDDSIPKETRPEWDARQTDYVLETCPFCGCRKKFRLTLILNEENTRYEKDAD